MDRRRRTGSKNARRVARNTRDAHPPQATRVAETSEHNSEYAIGSAHLETIAIDAIAAGGDGVGRINGLAVFVPRTAPGDVAQISVTPHGRFARGRVAQIISPSPLRVAPACRHYVADDCGGCQLQHLSIVAQRDVKSRLVRDTITRIGRRTVEVPHVHPSPAEWEYRRKLTLTLARRRVTDAWTGGLHPLGRANTIFPLEECRISNAHLVTAWHAARSASRFLPDGLELRLTFRLASATNGVAITVRGGTTWPHWSEFASAIDGLTALWWKPVDAPRQELIAPPANAEETAADFVQVNSALAASLAQYVLEQVLHFAPTRVVDAYAGTGSLALSLAERGVVVTAIEWDRDAVALLQPRLPRGSSALAAAVEDVIAQTLEPSVTPDVVVLNPPRTGVDPRVTAALVQQTNTSLRGIVYVSCDPATLARDVNRLPGWRIQSLYCFDMFPQTAHVETVCVLVPEAS